MVRDSGSGSGSGSIWSRPDEPQSEPPKPPPGDNLFNVTHNPDGSVTFCWWNSDHTMRRCVTYFESGTPVPPSR